MSYLMYPKVFTDYMTRIQKKGPLMPYLPSLVYFYAMAPGESFNMTLPADQLPHLLLAGERALHSQLMCLLTLFYCF